MIDQSPRISRSEVFDGSTDPAIKLANQSGTNIPTWTVVDWRSANDGRNQCKSVTWHFPGRQRWRSIYGSRWRRWIDRPPPFQMQRKPKVGDLRAGEFIVFSTMHLSAGIYPWWKCYVLLFDIRDGTLDFLSFFIILSPPPPFHFSAVLQSAAVLTPAITSSPLSTVCERPYRVRSVRGRAVVGHPSSQSTSPHEELKSDRVTTFPTVPYQLD